MRDGIVGELDVALERRRPQLGGFETGEDGHAPEQIGKTDADEAHVSGHFRDDGVEQFRAREVADEHLVP
jgi:hypothetical protein